MPKTERPVPNDATPKPKWIEHADEDRDSMHLARLYPSTNLHGIPDLPSAPLSSVPEALIAFRDPRPADLQLTNLAVHFYLDDYRFQSVWTKPWRTADALDNGRYTVAITPDFSVYRDMPDALRRFNVYRNRWCGCFWREVTRLQVIPSISWNGPDTWSYAFAGVERGSVVAVNGIGVDAFGPTYTIYKEGYLAMLEAIQPAMVLSYGPMPLQLKTLVPTREYPTRWKEINARARQRRQELRVQTAQRLFQTTPAPDQGGARPRATARKLATGGGQ